MILEPTVFEAPKPGFLAEVRDLAHRHGALLVFDETITGFRFANGGAQELFGVVPDLAAFGKGLANGYPVSAIAGPARIMREMEEIFFSFTFGGEALSLAAALATLEKLQREPVVRALSESGARLVASLQARIDEFGLGDVMSLSGHPSWSFLAIRDAPGCTLWELKTLLLQELFARGVLTLGTHNMSYAHRDEDLDFLDSAYAGALAVVGDAVKARTTAAFLRCKPLEPLFRVR